jgi:2-keto-4-pentenoate hydratase/2-oxohepta-3-ene-1,7-dioic acid hydratase in catechol pathway
MQFVRYLDGATPTWGVKTEGSIHGLAGSNIGEPDWGDLMNPSYLDMVRQSVAMDALETADPGTITYLSPIATPGKIVCVGLNYHDHADEQDEDIPEQPLLFAKAPTSVTHPGAPIIHPPDIDQVDYEVELAVVMGRTAHRVAASDARDYIAGYTVHNDISARDAQFGDGQWFRGKSYDTFAPLGPTLVPDADIDPNDLDLSLRVNGEVKQDSSTAEFIFDVDELVEYISHAMTLRPGDLISTGTPGGVGIFRDPPDLLAPGDHIEAEIESIGVLRNHVTAR